MASAPDISSMMPKNEPSKVEQAQQRMGAERSEWATRVLVGDPNDGYKNPGVAALLSHEIDQMYSPQRLVRERGKMNVGLQQQFSGAKTLRDMALSGETGSGVGRNALRTQYSGLAAAREQGATGVQTKARAMQEKARTGFVKMGEGITDNVTTAYNNLAQLESSRAQTLMQKAQSDAERSLRTQTGLMELGAGALGFVASAASGTLASKGTDSKTGQTTYGYGDAKNSDGFLSNFGRNLGTGLSGGAAGIYRK